MFIPNTTCKLFRALEGHTTFGEPVGFDAGTVTKCGVVRINLANKKTSVRADSSASRGSSDETAGNSILLFPSGTVIEIDDAVYIQDFLLEVIGIEPRFHIAGHIDHLEVELQRKEANDGIAI